MRPKVCEIVYQRSPGFVDDRVSNKSVRVVRGGHELDVRAGLREAPRLAFPFMETGFLEVGHPWVGLQRINSISKRAILCKSNKLVVKAELQLN